MNRDNIIQMARDSGMELYGLGKNREKFLYHLERFFHMAQAAEREACAKACERRGMVKGGEVFAARIRARGQA